MNAYIQMYKTDTSFWKLPYSVEFKANLFYRAPGQAKKEEKKSRITRTCNHTMPSVPLAWHVILNEGKQDGHKFKTQRLRQENQKFQAPGPGWISWRHTKEPKKKRTFSSRSKTKDTNSYQRRKHNAQLWGVGLRYLIVYVCAHL